MAFTPDELQAFNDILERRLAAQQRETERLFEQQVHRLRRDFEQRLITSQQEIVRLVAQQLHEQQKKWQAVLQQRLGELQMNVAQVMSREGKSQQMEQLPISAVIDQALAAQLLAIEELLDRTVVIQGQSDKEMPLLDGEPRFEAIEVQTDLPWEELIDVFGKVLDERLSGFAESMLSTFRNWEQIVSSRLHAIQTQLHEVMVQSRQTQTFSGNLTTMQEVFQSIEQLEHLIESMQVAVTTNQALLSNRLYHHQQLPLERAHPGGPIAPTTIAQANPNGATGPRSLPGER
jgi:hypothetical protein